MSSQAAHRSLAPIASLPALIALGMLLLCRPALALGPNFSADSLKFRHVWVGAQLVPGFGQVVNRQHWKLPILYAGIGSMTYLGIRAHASHVSYRNRYRYYAQLPYHGPQELEIFRERYMAMRYQRNAFLTAAYAFYVASIADALIVFAGDSHSPSTALALSAVLPGLGQVYNQNHWKVPLIYAGFGALYFYIDLNHREFQRWRLAQLYLTDGNPDTQNQLSTDFSKEEIIFYKDAFRRNRDLGVLIFAGLYMLNIIDAYVDGHFYDWDVSHDLGLRVAPHIDWGLSASTEALRPLPGLRVSLNF